MNATSPGLLPWSLAGALVLLAGAIAAFAVRIMRRADAEPTFPASEPLTRPSAVRIFSHGDIARYVAHREPGAPLVLRECLADLIAFAFDDEPPVYGEDWGPWLERNYERLRAVAVEETSRQEYMHATRGGS